METLWQDLRYALRGLRRAPGFTAAAVATLALGIGANTAIFSLLDAIVLRTLPVPNPAELSTFYQSMPPDVGDSSRSDIFSYQTFSRLQRAAPELSVAAMGDAIARVEVRLGAAGTPAPASLQLVSGGFFDTLGVDAAAGRLFGPDDDDEIDAEPVVVLRYGFAQRHFGDVTAAIGQTVRVNATVSTVVGVARNDFPGVFMGDAVDLYVPTAMQHAVGYRQSYSRYNAESLQPWRSQPGIEWLNVIARGRPADLQRADAALALAYREELAAEAARRGDSSSAPRWQRSRLERDSFAGGRSAVRTQFSRALLILMAMVGVVLVVACANIANLLLARASARRTELAIRQSLGAGRGRLVRQMVVEGLCLAAAGSMVAVPLGLWAGTGLAELASVRNLLPARFVIDPLVLLFAIGVTTATGILVAAVPAWRATSHDPARDLKSGPGRVTAGSGSMNMLVGSQVALSVVLVAAAALLGRTLVNLQQVDPGFDRERLLGLSLDVMDRRAFQPADVVSLRDELLRRTRAVPGVVAAEVSTTGTLSGVRSIGSIQVDGYVPQRGERVRAQVNRVGPGYFHTVGMRLRHGRLIDDGDSAGRPGVAVVNEAFARRYVPGRSPIGVRIGMGGELDTQIVGVTSDARVNGLRQAAAPMAFFPLAQQPDVPRYLDVRVNRDAGTVGAQVGRALVGLDSRIRIGPVTPIESALTRSTNRDRMMAVVSFGFAAMALLLACIGTYGALAYRVTRRSREMGLRAALGATPAALARLVLSDGLHVAVPGLIVGVVLALAGARLLDGHLFGVDPYDVPTYVTAVGTLLIGIVAACHLPARRAASVDPAVALRAE